MDVVHMEKKILRPSSLPRPIYGLALLNGRVLPSRMSVAWTRVPDRSRGNMKWMTSHIIK
jgi:hypothetical protein